MLSVASFRDVVGPLSQAVGERLARLLGVNEEIGLRLERIHADVDATAFRVRQIGWTAAAFAVGLFAAVVVRLRPASGSSSCWVRPLSPSSSSNISSHDGPQRGNTGCSWSFRW
jgi:hypothetical protein